MVVIAKVVAESANTAPFSCTSSYLFHRVEESIQQVLSNSSVCPAVFHRSLANTTRFMRFQCSTVVVQTSLA